MITWRLQLHQLSDYPPPPQTILVASKLTMQIFVWKSFHPHDFHIMKPYSSPSISYRTIWNPIFLHLAQRKKEKKKHCFHLFLFLFSSRSTQLWKIFFPPQKQVLHPSKSPQNTTLYHSNGYCSLGVKAVYSGTSIVCVCTCVYFCFACQNKAKSNPKILWEVAS